MKQKVCQQRLSKTQTYIQLTTAVGIEPAKRLEPLRVGEDRRPHGEHLPLLEGAGRPERRQPEEPVVQFVMVPHARFFLSHDA